MPRHATSTSFRPGQSGNPRGLTPGTQTQKTIAAREVANQLVDDPEYLEALRRRLLSGAAGAIEVLLWHYAKGKPVERVEQGAPGEFAALSDSELKQKLTLALAKL